MVKILAIGNSFSEDATYFLHSILDAAGLENKVVNLYIGGCSLERHWNNIEKDIHEYQFQLNGRKTDSYVSISDIIKEEWDFIVTHQASHDSGWLDTYEPFLGRILDYLKENAPKARIFINKTWAYEVDSTHECFIRYNRNQAEMFEKLSAAYKIVADKYSLPLIPSGDLIQGLRASGYFPGEQGRSICRDGFHMNFLYGRYALAALWAKYMVGINIKENTFVPNVDFVDHEEVDAGILNVIKNMVEEL